MNSTIAFFLVMFILASCASHELKQKSPTQKKADLYYAEGTNKLVQGEHEDALSHLLKAHKLDPDNSKVNNNLGMVYFFKKRKKLAIKHIKKAIEVDPKNSDARNNYASLLLEFGRYREARKHYQMVLNDLVYKFQYRTYYNLALIDLKLGNTPEAIRHLRLSLEKNDQYCPAHYQLGLIAKDKYEYHKALDRFKKATLGTCYNSPAPHYFQAKMLTLLEKTHSALHKYKEIMENFPKSQYSVYASRELRQLNIRKMRKTPRRKKGPTLQSKIVSPKQF